jgi:hypothetical protein
MCRFASTLKHPLVCTRYQQDNDREDLHWTEVFCKPRKTRVVSLPPAAAAILRTHGFDSPVKNNPPPKRKRPLPADSSKPTSVPKPKPTKRRSSGKQQAGGSSQVTPRNTRLATRSQVPVTPRSQQLRSGNRRKGTPMSLTNKKRRLQLHGADSSPGAASEDSSAHQIELAGASAAGPDSGGSGAAAPMAEDSDYDEELHAFDSRRREINAGKKRKADEDKAEATGAAAECARRAAGLWDRDT